MFSNIRDFLWVLQAYLRGKLLRQKAYRLQGNMFRLPVPVTTKRILMLIKWWGHRPLTIKEAEALLKRDADRVPFLDWDGKGWRQTDGSDWDTNHRFIFRH